MTTADSVWSNSVSVTVAGFPWPQKETGRLTVSDPVAGALFGASAALNRAGDLAIVGVPGNANSKGGFYVFTRSGSAWSQQQKIVPLDAQPGDAVGTAVALTADGTMALVSALYNAEKGQNAGTVYVYTRSGTTWQVQQKLYAPVTYQADGYFGRSVALSEDGTTVLIGQGAVVGTPNNPGYVLYYSRALNSFSFVQRFTAADVGSADNFGASVALNNTGTKALIGATRQSEQKLYGGAAYVYAKENNAWVMKQKLFASDATESAYFGASTAFDKAGTIALIGAPGAQVSNQSNVGQVYAFSLENGSFAEKQKITASDAVAQGLFGTAVALSGDAGFGLVGAMGSSLGVDNRGTGYTFE